MKRFCVFITVQNKVKYRYKISTQLTEASQLPQNLIKFLPNKEIKYFIRNISKFSDGQTNFQEPEDDDFQKS